MTPPADTAAALWTAIRYAAGDFIRDGDEQAIGRAITAHVEAEVARRLAPNLELWRWKCHDETIEQAIERLVRERNEYAEKLCERNAALVMAPDVEAAIAKYGVQAAGGADTTAAETALRAAFAADKARAVEAGISAAFATLLPGRPTPDEARRLVDAYGRECELRESERDPDARTALLRALGVES